MIVDDGGDMTILLIEGSIWEEKYEKTNELPDPSSYEADDEKALYGLLKRVIPSNTKRFRALSKDLKGISEETTTGVMRLY